MVASAKYSKFILDEENVKCIMYLIMHEYYENVDNAKNFTNVIINFGKSLGDDGKIITPMVGSYKKTRKEVLNLLWNNTDRDNFEIKKDPWLIIIPGVCKNLNNFDPNKYEFIILDFYDAMQNPFQYIDILNEISKEIKRGGNIFRWKQALDEHKDTEAEKRSSFFKNLLDAFEIKPGVFGLRVDLKKLLDA